MNPDYSEKEVHFSDARPWRRDGRCGKKFLLKNDKPAQCNPETSDETDTPPAFCCGDSGWCGATAKHCPEIDGLLALPRSAEINQVKINYAKINVKQKCRQNGPGTYINGRYLRVLKRFHKYFNLDESWSQCCTRASGWEYSGKTLRKKVLFPHKVCPNYPSAQSLPELS